MEECKMFLFKAVLMCQECGEIHGEKWLETRNRHASQTVIEMLCDSCKENELDFDPFEKHRAECQCPECKPEQYIVNPNFEPCREDMEDCDAIRESALDYGNEGYLEEDPFNRVWNLNHDDICPSCHAVAYQCNCFLEEDEDNE
jgi:hypothetical protein